MKRYKKFAIAGVALSIVSVLAGCSATEKTAAAPSLRVENSDVNTISNTGHQVTQNKSGLEVGVGAPSVVPSHLEWIEFDTPKIGTTIQPGEEIAISGHVLLRSLYSTSIQVTVRRYGYGENATLQYFKVSDTGTFRGTVAIPKQLPGEPGKTRYNLSFWIPDRTSNVDYVLTLK